jgi:parallel beta-helix repeat protein
MLKTKLFSFRASILALAAGLAPGFAQADTVNLTSGGDLQAAINATPGGGRTINLGNGTYSRGDNQAFEIGKSNVTIIGTNGSANVTISVTASGAAAGFIIYSGNSNITIQGVKLTLTTAGGIRVGHDGSGTTSNITLRDVDIDTTASGANGIFTTKATFVTIENSRIRRADINAIYISNASHDAVIKNCTVDATNNSAQSAGAIVIQDSDRAYLYKNTLATVQPNAQGIYLEASADSVIDSNTVTRGPQNGIKIRNGNGRNIVMNNTISKTDSQHGIAIQNSDDNLIVGNTLRNVAFHTILVLGGRNNIIERNDMAQFGFDTGDGGGDGVVLSTDSSVANRKSYGNTICKNIVDSVGKANGRKAGTGIWLDGEADFGCVVGNTSKGNPEAGVTSFNSSNNLIKGNKISNNKDAGVLLWDAQNWRAGAKVPAFNYVHNNDLFDMPSNGNFYSRGATDNDVAFNVMRDPAKINSADAGINLDKSPDTGNTTTKRSKLYMNTLIDLATGNSIEVSTTTTQFFRNRYINSPLSYAYDPLAITWDSQVSTGGNYWSQFSASGNPSRTTPYTDFVIDSKGTRGGKNKDRFPFQSEDYGLGSNKTVTVLSPVAATVAAAGSMKTIEWRSMGCVFVDIYYVNGGSVTAITTNAPDTGYYLWTVPTATVASTYQIRVDCKNSSMAPTGQIGTGSMFTIAGSKLVLLSPGCSQLVTANPTTGGSTKKIRVAWKKDATIAGVDVLLSTDGGSSFTVAATNISATNYTDIDAGITSTAKAVVKIRATADQTNSQDTTDGYFTLRNNAAGAFANVTASQKFLVGSIADVYWSQPDGASSVDLAINDGGTYTTIAANLPACSNSFSWFVPELPLVSTNLRLTFKDSAGTQIGSPADSATISVKYTTATATDVPLFRLYNNDVKVHLYSTDSNENTQLPIINPNWKSEATVGSLVSAPAIVDGVEAIPYYRLYRWPFLRHFYTSSRFEYFVLRDSGAMDPEGPMGYIFPSQVTGTKAFYRLSHKIFPFHLWTVDKNEYDTLVCGSNPPCAQNNGAWTGEGIVGYVK